MSEGQTATNLKVLETDYEIVGELRSGEWARTYIAKRKADGADVLISVARPHKNGENNALNHYAADTQLLSKLEHPQLPKVFEGRWVGKDEFAVVIARRQTDTLGELLSRGERFSPPRIAQILGEVSSTLDWARGQGVVHRGVTPETLAFERGTNRVLLSFAPTPIPIDGVPDACADARTVGTLAADMLSGGEFAEGQSLSDARPDLARRVIDDTDAIIRCKSGGAAPDAATFLAVIAAADGLKAGELEVAETQAQLLEARRTELAEFEEQQRAAAALNKQLEEQLANERAEFARKMVDEAAQLASLQEDFAGLKASEESQLAIERAQLDQERHEFDARVADLEAKHMDLDTKHAELDRIRGEEGERIDAAIAAAVETVVATAVPSAVDESDAPNAPWRSSAPEVPRKPWMSETVKKHSVGKGQRAVAMAAANGDDRPRWLIPVAALAGVLLLAAAGVALTHRNDVPPSSVAVGGTTVVPTPPETNAGSTPKGGFMTQSAGGAVGPAAGPPLAPQSSSAPETSPAAPAAADTTARKPAATLAPVPASSTEQARRDSIARRARIIRDSVARRDSIRRDSIRRDSIARDTLTVGAFPRDTMRRR